MPLLGAHMAISGGLQMAFERIREVRGEALQIFTKNERQWNAPAIAPEAAELFRSEWEKTGNIPVAAHDSYLINLAAVDPKVVERSVSAFSDELRRCSQLGIRYLITHPGSHLGQGIEEGIRKFAANLDRAVELSRTEDVEVLIETTAGQGTNLGSTFEEISAILTNTKHAHRLGVCFDTCHAFAAGYDIRTKQVYEETFSRLDNVIGLERIKFFHLNDCKKDLGSRVDRHEHIGKGKIGVEGFRLLLNDPRFTGHPMVLETPKSKDLSEDRENLKVLRSLITPGQDIPAFPSSR